MTRSEYQMISHTGFGICCAATGARRSDRCADSELGAEITSTTRRGRLLARGWITLSVAETRSFEPFVLPSNLRFRAAVAFYPRYRAVGLRPGIPTLILIGAVDDRTPSEDCSHTVARWGSEGPTIEQVVYPGTHHGFYYPHLQPGRTLFGHWLEYNGDAADNASVRMRQFLNHHLN
jgi:dienelactone hydrolase